MSRLVLTLTALGVLLGGLGLGALAVNAATIRDEPGTSVSVDPVVAPLSTTQPSAPPATEQPPAVDDPIPVVPKPQPIDDDDDDDDEPDDDDDGADDDD